MATTHQATCELLAELEVEARESRRAIVAHTKSNLVELGRGGALLALTAALEHALTLEHRAQAPELSAAWRDECLAEAALVRAGVHELAHAIDDAAVSR